MLAESVEAWGFRAMRDRDELLDRETTASAVAGDRVPARGRDAAGGRPDLGPTETEAYMRIAAERYRLLRTHDWSDDVLQQVLQGRRRPPTVEPYREATSLACARP